MRLKTLRSMIAILLCAVLAFSFCLTASAENVQITKIELENDDAVTFYENCAGHWEECYNAKTKQVETYFEYDLNFWNTDCAIRVYYSDNTEEVMQLSDFQAMENVWIMNSQPINHWTKDGEDNYFMIEYPGGRTLMPVQIVDSPVASLQIVRLTGDENDEQIETPVESLTFIENTNGDVEYEYDEENEEEISYFRYNRFDNVRIKITYTDGSEPYYAMPFEVVPGFSDSVRFGQNQSANDPWLPDKENVLIAEYMGVATSIPVFIAENPVESIEPVQGSALHLIENVDGHFNTYYDPDTDTDVKYFDYDVYGSGVMIVIHYKDPSREDRISNLFEWVDDYEVRFIDEQSDHPWSPEKDNNVLTVEYMNATTEIPVVFDENPVESIEILDAENNPLKALTLVENGDGAEITYHHWEDDSEETYFHYEVDASKIHILIHYTDGTEQIAYPYQDLNGHNISVGNDQSENHWEKGKENILAVEYMGKTATVPVIIVDNPVDHIEIVKGSELHFVENTNGHWDRFDWLDIDFFRYDIDRENVQIKIYYKDENREPVIANLYEKIDGYEVKTLDLQPWSPNEENFLAVGYMGKYQPITVVFDDNPVDHIEITGADTYLVLENADGSYETRALQDGTEEEYFRYNVRGNEFTVKIVYSNGDEYIADPFEMVNGYRVEAGRDQSQSPWVYRGNNRLVVDYLGHTDSIPVKVVTGDVNNDGETNILDMIRLNKRILDGFYDEHADVDQDGDVDEDDLNLLMEILRYENHDEIKPIEFESDINHDGETNVLDMIRLKKIISEGTYNKAADLNNDGRMDAEDLTLLFQTLL